MKILLITLLAALSLAAHTFASSPTLDLAPKSIKVCITVHGGYELICFKITVENLRGSVEELNLIGKIDGRTNRLNVTGFPQEFNTEIFTIDEDTPLRPADKDGETFILKSGKYQIKEGRSSLLMTKS
jgi:hypothetical protein